MKIFINPGHSPQWEIDTNAPTDPEPGAVANGLQENIIAKSVSDLIEHECKKIAIGVAGNLQSSSLYEITDTANATDADIFVSIHCNNASPSASGTETFYCEGSSKGRKIAQCVQRALIAELGTVDRGVKDDTQTALGRTHVLRQSNMPAILVELAFISNGDDAQLLKYNQSNFARAIVKGLAEYGGISHSGFDVEKSFDVKKIAVLTRKYESNGDLACVSSGVGDMGGVSYGLYQFSSILGIVDDFVNWLNNYPDPAFANYELVLAMNKVNSEKFKKQWRELGTIDPGNFGRLQDEYIKLKYYDTAARKLLKESFNLDNHSDALKAVVLSRSIQNGPTGCTDLFIIAAEKLGKPLSALDNADYDSDLISAIYDFLIVECDLAKPSSNGIWHSPDDFCHGGKNVIIGLRRRFVSERADALALLT